MDPMMECARKKFAKLQYIEERSPYLSYNWMLKAFNKDDIERMTLKILVQ